MSGSRTDRRPEPRADSQSGTKAGSRAKVLAVAGSPRRHGNSERLLDACIEGMRGTGDAAAKGGVRGTGVLVDKLVVVEHDIRPCRGCNACSLTGECAIRDGMLDVYPRIDEADAIVVGTPVYFATVPAVLKALYDRLQPYWARRYVLHEEPVRARRPGGIMAVRGGGDPFGFVAAVYATKSVFAVLGVDCVEEVKVAGVDSPGDLGRHADRLEEAREAGRRLAESASTPGQAPESTGEDVE